jgi:glutamate synthase domain-containing protein 3
MQTHLDVYGLNYQSLNAYIRKAADDGCLEYTLKNVNGQRFIGAGMGSSIKIAIYGTPGNNLAAMMDGAHIDVFGNAQDGVGNTMNDGRVIIHGNASDTVGYGMRGGEIFIRGRVGCRVGIHMKAGPEKSPKIVIGGSAGDFLGEYMAGGCIVLLGLNLSPFEIVGRYVGTGMHGGTIYIRGEVPQERLSREVYVEMVRIEDDVNLQECLEHFSEAFSEKHRFSEAFSKITPVGHRPFGSLYTH